MRVVVFGASGNVGTAVARALQDDPAVEEIVGVARRRPRWSPPKLRWETADIVRDDLVGLVRGADAVVHLAWLIQPSRDEAVLRAVNVTGSERVFAAVAEAGVPALVYASSIGAYSPGPKDRRVDESWPTGGIPSSFYARHKAEVERLLDRFEREHPDVRTVRLRPGLIFQREAASEIRRLFAGPFLPSPLLRRGWIPVVPDTPRLKVQALHARDVADAYRRAVRSPEARGAYNVAAEPVLDPQTLGRVLGARLVRVPERALRGAAALTWRLRLQPTPPGWVDLAFGVPLMDTTRIRTELGWSESTGAGDALLELLDGLRHGDGMATPPLDPATGGPARSREITTGIGGRGG